MVFCTESLFLHTKKSLFEIGVQVLGEIFRQKQIDSKNEKEIRRRLREEKRKAKILKKLEISGSDEINEKIANEEKKLLKVQRKLEAIRLIEELFRRIKEKMKDQEEVDHHTKIARKNQDEVKKG